MVLFSEHAIFLDDFLVFFNSNAFELFLSFLSFVFILSLFCTRSLSYRMLIYSLPGLMFILIGSAVLYNIWMLFLISLLFLIFIAGVRTCVSLLSSYLTLFIDVLFFCSSSTSCFSCSKILYSFLIIQTLYHTFSVWYLFPPHHFYIFVPQTPLILSFVVDLSLWYVAFHCHVLLYSLSCDFVAFFMFFCPPFLRINLLVRVQFRMFHISLLFIMSPNHACLAVHRHIILFNLDPFLYYFIDL